MSEWEVAPDIPEVRVPIPRAHASRTTVSIQKCGVRTALRASTVLNFFAVHLTATPLAVRALFLEANIDKESEYQGYLKIPPVKLGRREGSCRV